jgi:hypothetical protein
LFGGEGGLHASPGLTTWVVDEAANDSSADDISADDSSASERTAEAADGAHDSAAGESPGVLQSMRPPAACEAEWLGPLLQRCVRLMPHQDNCGGFFVAALRLTAAAGEEAVDMAEEAVEAVESVADEAEPEVLDETATAEAPGVDKPSRPQRGRRRTDNGACELRPLDAHSSEWYHVARFYDLTLPEGHSLLWAPGRAAQREKVYLATAGAAAALTSHWQPAAASGRARALAGRLQAVGVKAFERLKLTNVRDRHSN